MVELVHRAVDHRHVAPPVHVGQHGGGHGVQVVDVHIGVDHDEALAQHHQAQTPKPVHDLLRVAGKAWLEAHDHQVVEDPLGGHIDIGDLALEQLHQRQEKALGSLAHPVIFHRRLADHRRRVDCAALVRDRRHVEHRERVRRRVEAGMVAKRPFQPVLVGIDVAFDHDLGVGRGLDVLRDALDERHRLAAQPPGQQVLVDVGRQRGGPAPRLGRVAAQGDRARDTVLLDGARLALVLRAAFVALPVHAQRAAVVFLQAVHAHVARPRDRIARDDLRQGDVRAAVLRPAGGDRQQVQRGIVGDDHLLAGRFALADAARSQANAAQRAQEIDPAPGHAAQILRQPEIDQLAQIAAQVFELVDAQRQRHPPRRAVGVDQHRHGRAFDVFEQQRLVLRGGPFAHPVSDLGDLQVRADGRRDAHQLAFGFQPGDKRAQIGVGHGISPGCSVRLEYSKTL